MEIGRSRIVGRSNFDEVLGLLQLHATLALDTETYGLRPYHGDKLFSIILATDAERAFYFNFQPYPNLDPDLLLTPAHLQRLNVLFKDPTRLWYIQRAKYDMAIMWQDQLELAGTLHCTEAIGRVWENWHFTYNLDDQLRRIDPALGKDDKVKEWILANKAYTEFQKPGRKEVKKALHYDRAPWELIVPYALWDARACFITATHQIETIKRQSSVEETPEGNPVPMRVMENERRLTRTVFNMERTGILVDLDYCKRAAEFENARIKEAHGEFKRLSGKDYAASPVLFAEVFADDKERWEYTEKKNPSFESEVLQTFKSPLAGLVLQARDAKAKSDFYTGFIYHADARGRVHPNFNQGGANHGRFSSSDPNFQNLKADEEEDLVQEFIVRRAVIPTPGYFLCSIDYKTMEYVQMLEYACAMWGRVTPLAAEVNAGKDVHQATADLASKYRPGTKRRETKTSNFLELYGGGTGKLASQLDIPIDDAWAIKRAIQQGAPEIKVLQKKMMRAAETRGYVRNWLGRRCYFHDARFAYKAPNHLIAGGCADIIKIAMNLIDDYLAPYKSRMILNIHDELVFEIWYGEEFLIAELKQIMESVFPSKWVPLTCSVSTSTRSLADLEDWKEAA